VWRYLNAALEGTLDELLDPRVLIEQAIDEAKRRHTLLAEQAAAVLGNERELEIRIRRTETEAGRLRASARQALVLADRARASGEETRAAGYEASAAAFAGQLTVVEASASDLRTLLETAAAASRAARRGVEQNAFALQDQLTQRARLLTQLEASKLQERMADAVRQVGSFAPADATASLAAVSERIDARFARATGRGELAADAFDARMLDVRKASLDIEAERRLAEIRAAMAAEKDG
jgi:phage shock protein A